MVYFSQSYFSTTKCQLYIKSTSSVLCQNHTDVTWDTHIYYSLSDSTIEITTTQMIKNTVFHKMPTLYMVLAMNMNKPI